MHREGCEDDGFRVQRPSLTLPVDVLNGLRALSGSAATFLLYLLLLPVNAVRLRQLLRLVKKARSATQGDMSMEWIKPFMTERKYRRGDTLFKIHDTANEMFLTVTGKFLVKEINVEIPPGRLMGELGYLENPDYYLGMLRAQAMRAVRVIVDIGMHLELTIPATEAYHPGETWNADLGQEFCLQRAQFPPDFMQSEVIRYLGTPGQAISYKVGERCWLEARQSSKQRQGEAFDLKAWHTAALNLGPMGLAQMQRELARV